MSSLGFPLNSKCCIGKKKGAPKVSTDRKQIGEVTWGIRKIYILCSYHCLRSHTTEKSSQVEILLERQLSVVHEAVVVTGEKIIKTLKQS